MHSNSSIVKSYGASRCKLVASYDMVKTWLAHMISNSFWRLAEMINSLRKDLLISLFCVSLVTAPFCPYSVYIEVEICFKRRGHPKRSCCSRPIQVYFRLHFSPLKIFTTSPKSRIRKSTPRAVIKKTSHNYDIVVAGQHASKHFTCLGAIYLVSGASQGYTNP